MWLSVLLFFVFSFIAYTLISWFGQLTGGSPGNLREDVLEVFKPIPLLILLVSNAFFAAGLSFGFTFSKDAIPMAVAVGVIASFVYSALFLGANITWLKILGVVFVLVGIYLLK
jgi:drug/metabolite transporter (DMT)-like permease